MTSQAPNPGVRLSHDSPEPLVPSTVGVVITVATIDNHPVVRSGLAQHLSDEDPDLRVIASAATVEEFLATGTAADVILLDLLLDEGRSTDAIPGLVSSGAKVLVYTTEERPVPLREAVAAGASGVLLKNDPLATVSTAIRDVMAGEFCCSGSVAHALLADDAVVARLSPRQIEILHALNDGLDYRSAAKRLGISEGAVKTQLTRIREKYRSAGVEAGNSHHLTKLAQDDGYLG